MQPRTNEAADSRRVHDASQIPVIEPEVGGNVEFATGTPPRDNDEQSASPAAVGGPISCRQGTGEQAGRQRTLPSIEGYEILGVHGFNATGVVIYHARQKLLNRPCLLKMTRSGSLADRQAASPFRMEAEIGARLQHPNIVEIYDFGRVNEQYFCELEFVEGGDLARRLDGTPWPTHSAAQLIVGLTRGIQEAHRCGIVHCDLKPSNVLLARDGTPKIGGFGSLESETGLTEPDVIMGTPAYMSPEQAEGRPRSIGPATDIHALGVILYELVTGTRPFRGSLGGILEQVRSMEPVEPSRLVAGLPRDLETIILKCMQKEPEKRYASATALGEDLQRFLRNEPIVA